MPWCDDASFATLPRAEQRRLFPAMLPALWKALAACPHGDLSPANLMIVLANTYHLLVRPGLDVFERFGGGRQLANDTIHL